MSLGVTVTLASLATGLLSLVGGVLLLYRRKLSPSVLRYLVSFAAGAMLAAAFLDLIPEAVATAGTAAPVASSALAGMVLFFLAEKFLLWHHHSHEHSAEEVRPVGPLVIIGDTLHNFIDGITIAVTFVVNPALGVVTTLAIIFHEIPQEVGDFAVLLEAGFARNKVLLYNLLSSGATLVGAWLTLLLRDEIASLEPRLVGLAAGIFIYIAAADLIPEIHRESNRRRMLPQVVALAMGIVCIGISIHLFT